MNLSVIGGGSWGAAISLILSDNGYDVSVWHHKDTVCTKINRERTHPLIKNIKIPNNISFISNISSLDIEIIFIALPSHSIIEVLKNLAVNKKTLIVNCSKGFDNISHSPFSSLIPELLKIEKKQYICLSGPSHSEEIVKKLPTALVSSSKSKNSAETIQKLMSNSYLRVYTNTDVIGVETGGACKNIFSIAAGICLGLGYGINTISALISRGLNEMVKLGVNMGANKKTFYGLSGLGDLTVTTFSDYSRNRQFGRQIGEGYKMKQILHSMNMVVEGINATKIFYQIAIDNNVEVPIISEVYQILFENKKPRKAIQDLLHRNLTSESK